MICLGIDPGSVRCGYAVIGDGKLRSGFASGGAIRDAGFISMPADKLMAWRIRELVNGLQEVLDEHIQGAPALLCIEAVFSHPEYPAAALVLAQARGAVIATVTRLPNIDIIEPSARQVKKWMTGSGAATKQAVQRMVMQECGLSTLPEPHDVADAIALGLYGHHIAKLNQLAVA